MRLYGDLDAQYGKEVDPVRTYGTLFDQDPAPEEGLVVLFARLRNSDVTAEPASASVLAQLTIDPELVAAPDETSIAVKVNPTTVGWTLN